MGKKNLPVKKVVVSDPTEDDIAVNFVAMVDQPAIEIGWMAFNKESMVKPHDGESESEYMKRCVPVYINEGKEQDQAVAICINEWQSMKQTFAKVSYDWDGVGSTSEGKKKIAESISNGDTVYIITARDSAENININGIPKSQIIPTGSNKAKIEKIKELGISKHYDNNPDVIKELGNIGIKFIKHPFAFQIQNEERRIITGALMIADLKIFRRDQKTGEEYYIVFDAPTIEKIVKKFAKAGYHNNVNLMHIPELEQEQVYLIESFITDSKRGIKAPEMFGEIPDGSWFASYYVESDKAWDYVKSGKLTGFSVEGYFSTVETFSDQKKAVDFDELASRFIADF